MATKKSKFFDRCRCCLQDGINLRELWAEYIGESDREIYGEMMTECFAISLRQLSDHTEQICDSCIGRLKNALTFKKEVLASEQLLIDYLEDEAAAEEAEKRHEESEIVIKSECISESHSNQDDNHERKEEQYFDEEIESLEEERIDESDEEYIPDGYDETESQDENPEYLEVEFLEDEDDATGSEKQAYEQSVLKRKWPKKKKKEERTRTYRQYTNEDLKKCLDAVQNKGMSRSKAAELYKVPVKTLSAKLRSAAKEPDSEPTTEADEVRQFNQEKHTKFVDEIKTILTYTNATPYKTKSGRYYCAYCTECPFFEHPDELRTHARTIHASNRLAGIDELMRPHWLNEVIKLDIENLQCVVCFTGISSWNDMFKHLKDAHSVELDEAYTRVIPYCLSMDLHCALCGDKYPNYHLLDGHMNAHYSNYICGECGDTFLAENRLKKHVATHSVTRFPCSVCSKVFTLDKYRRKHFHNVHNSESKIKCLYCTERFRAEYARHVHVTECHPEKVKTFPCEICGKAFNWRPYYLKHMRLTHRKQGKKHKCQFCSKEFLLRYELRNHEDWHRGDSNHVCGVCNKKFTSKPYLLKHYKMHLEDATAVVVVENTKG